MHRFISREELEALFERVDEKLASENVPLHVRSLLAAEEVSLALGGIDLPLCSPSTPDALRCLPNAWIGDALHDWYQRRWGDAQNRRMDVGSIALRIRGAFFRARICNFYGCVELYIARAPDPLAGRRVPKDRSNVLDKVEGLPQAVRDTLSDREMLEIWRLYRLGDDAHFCLHAASADPMIRAARADHAAAVDRLVETTPHYGQSQWASLQAAEKTLKVAIVKRGKGYKGIGHDLHKLAALAQSVGFDAIPSGTIDALQCGSAVRYGEEEVTVDAALASHEAALSIARLARPILGCSMEAGAERVEYVR